eukprot:TRINITY_DN1909_c0_g1_i2.p4 TRINITY_DN1909_c0_g1~~TRINITY_DN1909_c0_g1_i2.p4  ORF type:complete len:107 (-),score=13.07 TRINITY_DN1909_c0_g1_i2:202-522(-)
METNQGGHKSQNQGDSLALALALVAKIVAVPSVRTRAEAIQYIMDNTRHDAAARALAIDRCPALPSSRAPPEQPLPGHPPRRHAAPPRASGTPQDIPPCLRRCDKS